MRFITMISAALLLTALSAAAQSSTYTDPKNGVSFQYPSVWTPVANPADYTQSVVGENSSIKPAFVVEFSPKGNLYEHTNLTGLAYLYFVVPNSDIMACAKLGDLNMGEKPKPTKSTIHGVHFQHSKGGDAGMSHQLDSDAYSVYRNGVCFIFEEIFSNISQGVIDDPGEHDLTSAQAKALQRHLDAITESIVFTPAKP
jgi:hypothetical protein